MKTRKEYIEAVKVKLEEISPFDEPESFIDGASDPDYDRVKPIVSYIEKNLDEAGHNCLRSLPLTLLHADIERTTGTMPIDVNGVGFIRPLSMARRFIRLRQDLLKRDITAFISSEDPLYLLQQNQYDRGGVCKPVAVIASDHDGTNAGQMEIYSFPKDKRNTNAETYLLLSINLEKHADDRSSGGTTDALCIKSPIEEFVVLECAALVSEIFGDMNTAQICRSQYNAKLQSIVQ